MVTGEYTGGEKDIKPIDYFFFGKMAILWNGKISQTKK
jgi:hypothetical protein